MKGLLKTRQADKVKAGTIGPRPRRRRCHQFGGRFLLQMVQYLPDNHGAFDRSDYVQGRTNAVGAGFAGTAAFALPPQARQVSMSILNTRFSL